MSEPVKIAFIGGPCTGKTTLFEELRSEYAGDPGAVFVEEAARDFFIEYDIPEEKRECEHIQGLIQEIALEREERAEVDDPHLIICDQSVVDPAVYTHAGDDIEGGNRLIERVAFWLPTYTQLYLLDPAGIPNQTDGIRYEDEANRQRIHESFLEFFAQHGIGYELLSGTVEERQDRVRSISALL